MADLSDGLKGAPILRSESQSTPRKKGCALISEAPTPPPVWPRRSGASVKRLGRGEGRRLVGCGDKGGGKSLKDVGDEGEEE